ncbi:MAG: glucose-1-phosphate adenylyltransferase [Planctomycetes bacterium]|nr:glucose-1-phosphate adenylyltransferase [Planctomycetota bacterium]
MTGSVLAIVLAGGKGTRLGPLTLHRAKPAVPFGGIYRIIDFPLSNAINSGLRKIVVLIQYKSLSLSKHLAQGWGFLPLALGEYVTAIPPQQRVGEHWYQGTADAIYQNINFIEQEQPEHVLVLAGDHVYKMDYGKMLDFHKSKGAELTIATTQIAVSQARHYGVMSTDDDYRITGFQEKPEKAKPLPHNSHDCMASMGIYIFNTNVLLNYLYKDARTRSAHDFGKNVIPLMLRTGASVYAYNFVDENKKAPKYWRDVGTIEQYWKANMDLVAVEPVLNLYDEGWPIRTYHEHFAPPKFVFAQEFEGGRTGVALDSTVSPGCIISGGRVQRSVLSHNVRVNSYARIEESVIFEGVNIGRHCHIRRAIIDKGVEIPEGTEIGYDIDSDRERFWVSTGGIVVISKAEHIEAPHEAMPAIG